MFPNNENALLYAIVPVLVELLQSNPYVFAAVIYCPAYFFRFGLAPSNPPCIGTINLRVVNATFVVNVELVNAASNEPEYGAAAVGNPAAEF